jgi:hypothetical protein
MEKLMFMFLESKYIFYSWKVPSCTFGHRFILREDVGIFLFVSMPMGPI